MLPLLFAFFRIVTTLVKTLFIMLMLSITYSIKCNNKYLRNLNLLRRLE